MELGEEQKQAFLEIISFIKSDQTSFSLTGAAGTGKSFLISKIIEWLEQNNYNYCLCAPTHKAKTVLEYYTKRKAITLHKLLSLSPKLDIINLDFRDLIFKMGNVTSIPNDGIIICDEASMISDDLFNLLLDNCKKFNCKIIFSSDKLQLKPVDSNRISLVYSKPIGFNLTKIYRQSSKNALFDTLQNLRDHKILKFKTSTSEDGNVVCESNFNKFFDLCVEGVKLAIKNENIFENKILAYTNDRVNKYNEYIVKYLFNDVNSYYKGEILTGCENLEYNNYNFYNSMDYVISCNPTKTDILINKIKYPAYDLLLYDVGTKLKTYVKILDKCIGNDFLEISKYIDNLRLIAINASDRNKRKFWARYYREYNSFTTPIDLYYDGRLIRKKSFDRGYAITVHKSQGSTLNNVFVDMFDILKCKDEETVRQLQYVALSRARKNVYIFQK